MATTFDMQPPPNKPAVKPQAGFSTEGVPDYMTQTPNAQMPNSQDSATLPMFKPQTGYSDTGYSTSTGTLDSARAGNDVVPEDDKDAPGTPD